MTFYHEEAMVLDEFKHLKTPALILRALRNINEIEKKKEYNQFEFSFSFRPSEIEFVKESLFFAQTTHEACEMPPFHGYYCTFSTMNEEQKNWYFYWRERFVNGDYLHTDLSYIYVFVYELINYSFNSSAAFNVSMLYRLYDAYKEQYRIDRFKYLIADMLLEMGESQLANKWNPYKEDMPELYEEMKDKTGWELTRISVNTWKGYVRNDRATLYFKSNRNKIYKTFKECLPVLEEAYREQNQNLVDLYFESKQVTRRRYLYSGMIVFREEQQNVPFEVEVVVPTKKLVDDMTHYFRVAENVTRMVNGENKLLPMEDDTLPEGLVDKMLLMMTQPKEKGRFKAVKQRDSKKSGSLIPQREEERPKIVIEFDDERIKKLQSETDTLVEEVEKRTVEYEEEIEEVVEEEIIEEATEENPVETPIVVMNGLDSFFASSGDDLDEEAVEEFFDSLEEVEKEFIAHFSGLVCEKQDAIQFLKAKGKMLGVVMGSINEKAQEYLEDNLFDEQGEELVIFEEFESVFLEIKEMFE